MSLLSIVTYCVSSYSSTRLVVMIVGGGTGAAVGGRMNTG